MGLILFVASVVALVFGSIWAFRAWGLGSCLGLAVGGGLAILIVPFGTIVVLVVSIVLMGAAQKRLFQRVADGEVDPDQPAWGFPAQYPYAPNEAGGTGGICPVCHQPELLWRADLGRWFCRACQESR